jgi:molybdopterin converting factor small subunit
VGLGGDRFRAHEPHAHGAAVPRHRSRVGDRGHPATQAQLFGEGGDLNRYVNVYLNDEDVRVLDGLDTAVESGDVLVILPAMAGGAR